MHLKPELRYLFSGTNRHSKEAGIEFSQEVKHDKRLNWFSLACLLFNKAILKYHVVSGTYFSAGLKDDMELTTLQGEKLKIVIDNNSTYKLFVFCKIIIRSIIKCVQENIWYLLWIKLWILFNPTLNFIRELFILEKCMERANNLGKGLLLQTKYFGLRQLNSHRRLRIYIWCYCLFH